jgi:hypothetical protein
LANHVNSLAGLELNVLKKRLFVDDGRIGGGLDMEEVAYFFQIRPQFSIFLSSGIQGD